MLYFGPLLAALAHGQLLELLVFNVELKDRLAFWRKGRLHHRVQVDSVTTCKLTQFERYSLLQGAEAIKRVQQLGLMLPSFQTEKQILSKQQMLRHIVQRVSCQVILVLWQTALVAIVSFEFDALHENL